MGLRRSGVCTFSLLTRRRPLLLPTGEQKDVPPGGIGWIDVRDVARAHIAAAEAAQASGRYIVSSESITFEGVRCGRLRLRLRLRLRFLLPNGDSARSRVHPDSP